MQRQSIVVLIKIQEGWMTNPEGTISPIDPFPKVESWGCLKEACEKHGWKYNTVTRLKLPIVYKDWKIYRVPFREIAK